MKVVIETYQGKVVNIIISKHMLDVEFYVADQDDALYSIPKVILDPESCETSKELAILTTRHLRANEERR